MKRYYLSKKDNRGIFKVQIIRTGVIKYYRDIKKTTIKVLNLEKENGSENVEKSWKNLNRKIWFKYDFMIND